MRKITALLLSFVFALTVLASCSKQIENTAFDTDGYVEVNGKKSVPEYVIKINGNNISFAEYRYYYLNTKSEIEGGNTKIWKEHPENAVRLKNDVEDTLVEMYSIRMLAEENGVEPDYELVDKEISEAKKQLSSDEFEKGLKDYYLTEELYEYILQGQSCYMTLFDHYFGEDGTLTMSEDELEQYLNQNFTHVKHILIYPNTTMSDSEYEAYIQSVLEKVQSSDDFDALIKEFSNDTAMPSYGYYFAEGEMPAEFENACDSLGIGEISGLVKTANGYHIIKKLAVNTSDSEELKDVAYNHMFDSLISKKINSVKVEYASVYDDISPFSVK